MNDLTLESLAKQVEALEKLIATKGPDQSRKDWRKVVGMFRDSEFMRKVDEECLRTREPEREAARRGEFEPIFERVPGLRVENWLD
jgi:hypothetical protein